ncbi:uncharacterized protein VSU04_001013 [Chlamydotis macqueenii]
MAARPGAIRRHPPPSAAIRGRGRSRGAREERGIGGGEAIARSPGPAAVMCGVARCMLGKAPAPSTRGDAGRRREPGGENLVDDPFLANPAGKQNGGPSGKARRAPCWLGKEGRRSPGTTIY